MKFKSLKKLHEGAFITRYDLNYETVDGKPKVYEMISRSHDLKSLEDLQNNPVEAVVLILTDESGDRILLNREFRMATGCWVYNFPAGLIDPGESPEIAAARELREETGLTLSEIRDIMGPSYSAIGFSNEKNVCVIGTATGEFTKSTSTYEEIEARWYTRAEIRELVKTEPFAARSQAWCYCWSHEKE
ncbi:ADP-ribose pyrophosphatase [Lachnospiraceae bacterium]|nr:ADP-ribose pyrophosphatase [Lachnospiraceae bacterium]